MKVKIKKKKKFFLNPYLNVNLKNKYKNKSF